MLLNCSDTVNYTCINFTLYINRFQSVHILFNTTFSTEKLLFGENAELIPESFHDIVNLFLEFVESLFLFYSGQCGQCVLYLSCLQARDGEWMIFLQQ